jgi:hypothetical protein
MHRKSDPEKNTNDRICDGNLLAVKNRHTQMGVAI